MRPAMDHLVLNKPNNILLQGKLKPSSHGKHNMYQIIGFLSYLMVPSNHIKGSKDAVVLQTVTTSLYGDVIFAWCIMYHFR